MRRRKFSKCWTKATTTRTPTLNDTGENDRTVTERSLGDQGAEARSPLLAT